MSQRLTTRRIHNELPIFLLEWPGRSILYSPGNVSAIPPSESRVVESAFNAGAADSPPWVARLVNAFMQRARQARESWERLSTAEYRPTCLTVYLSNTCDMACSYCYAAKKDGSRIRAQSTHRGVAASPDTSSPPVLNDDRLLPAARLVAKCCRERGQPFQLVLHGGGEPTLHWDLLQRVADKTRLVAEQFDVPWTSYMATHGVVDRQKAAWLGDHFDRVGISCDGPPDLHNSQRTRPSGEGTFGEVAETIRVLSDSPAALTLRATITRRSLQRQAEMVTFFHREWGVRDMTFEPVYRADQTRESPLTADDVVAFANHFLAAQEVANALNCRLSLSGVRLDEVHGPYCNVLRSVLQLLPDNSAVNCFLLTDARREEESHLVIAEADPQTGDLVLNVDRIRRIQSQATEIPARCEQCVNVYHCARDCPDRCPLDESVGYDASQSGVRCLIQRELGQRWIAQSALCDEYVSTDCLNGDTAAQCERIGQALRELPSCIRADAIVRQWRGARSFDRFDARSMPPPPWSSGGFHDDGEVAWKQLSRMLNNPGVGTEMSAYVHTPYCDRKCGFCDCYACFLPGEGAHKHIAYVNALIDEVQAWGQFEWLKRRPLTTVHFGGGTPSLVPPAHFERLLDVFHSTFRDQPTTEWALESTTSQLSPEYLATLRGWGFTRLHVGIQTLHDETRRLIGRCEDASTVLHKLALALDSNFIVSVDLIYGLPGQTLESFVRDVGAIVDLNLDGCSLYHLNTAGRNRAFIARHGIRPRPAFDSYLFFQVGEAILESRGYTKSHFAHFSRDRDKNLYYRHMVRGEDLLAFGTTADGCFGDYCYRHPRLARYLAETSCCQPALEGGLKEDRYAIQARPVMAGLIAGELDVPSLARLGALELLERWLHFGMLESCIDESRYILTANGSWYLNRLLAEVQQLTSSSHDA